MPLLTHISTMSNRSQQACHMVLNNDEENKLNGNDKGSIQDSTKETNWTGGGWRIGGTWELGLEVS
jgi:hypothetical protein